MAAIDADTVQKAINNATSASEVIARLDAAGYAIVPKEPTEAMVLAAPGRSRQSKEGTMYHGIWRAMVAASQRSGIT